MTFAEYWQEKGHFGSDPEEVAELAWNAAREAYSSEPRQRTEQLNAAIAKAAREICANLDSTSYEPMAAVIIQRHLAPLVEALEADKRRLLKALEPFARKAAEETDSQLRDVLDGVVYKWMKPEDFRRAQAAMKEGK